MFVRQLPLGLALWTLVGCSESETGPTVNYSSSLDVEQLMHYVLEPAADTIWDSAGTIATLEGVEDLAPTTDEGWFRVQHAAAVVSESGNLLLMPGRTMDGDDWQEISHGLVSTGASLMNAAEQQDADAIFDLGGQLYNVCVACHQRYWVENDQ
ncbi:MAG: hypothetical protein NZ743_01140 [Pseudomonadales bacterium]|nr:hypothetical protein [Pseudomonadales bacterium]